MIDEVRVIDDLINCTIELTRKSIVNRKSVNRKLDYGNIQNSD